MSVPKAMQEKYDEISSILIPYCDKYLSPEYKELCLHALEKLCRKRPSPLNSGRTKTWAASIVYAIGQNNFIFDKNQPVHVQNAAQLCEPFGVSKSTAANKAVEIRKMLKINYGNSEWILPSSVDDNPLVWMVEKNGLAVDARWLPLEEQIICWQKGLIPYVPAYKKAQEEAAAPSDQQSDSGPIENEEENSESE